MLFRTTEAKYRPKSARSNTLLDVLFILRTRITSRTVRPTRSGVLAVRTSTLIRPRLRPSPRTLRPAPRRRKRRSPAHAAGDRLGREGSGVYQARPKPAQRSSSWGFGHRVYKHYDPRARIIKKVAYEVFELMGKNPLLEIALECERIALEDEYFIKRKLYPNVDFYTGLIYQSMGFPISMFPVLFAIPRTSGWIAQWQEMLLDPEQKIARPRQIYLGHDTRHYVPIDQRS